MLAVRKRHNAGMAIHLTVDVFRSEIEFRWTRGSNQLQLCLKSCHPAIRSHFQRGSDRLDSFTHYPTLRCLWDAHAALENHANTTPSPPDRSFSTAHLHLVVVGHVADASGGVPPALPVPVRR